MRFFENIFSLDFFKLSGLVIVHTASLLVQEHSKSILWRNFVYKQVFHVDSFCISPMGTGWSTLNRARVEESLYNGLFIRPLQIWAYQAVSITLPEECSSGFVHWFPVWYFPPPRLFTRVPKHDPEVEVQAGSLPLQPGSLPLQPCGRSYR